MLPDRVSNPVPLTYESGALPIALRHPARAAVRCMVTLGFSRFLPVWFPKTERKSHVTIAL